MTPEEKQIHNAVHAELREFEEFKELVRKMREAQRNYYKDRPKVGYKVAYQNMVNKEQLVDKYREAVGRDSMAYERKEIDRKEVLTLLGRMYALTATGKGRIGLCRYIRKEGGPSITGKYTFMARAMLRIRLITHVDGKGVATLYRWNLKQYGPPSIPLADMIIAETAEQIRIAAKKRYYAKKERDGNAV